MKLIDIRQRVAERAAELKMSPGKIADATDGCVARLTVERFLTGQAEIETRNLSMLLAVLGLDILPNQSPDLLPDDLPLPTLPADEKARSKRFIDWPALVKGYFDLIAHRRQATLSYDHGFQLRGPAGCETVDGKSIERSVLRYLRSNGIEPNTQQRRQFVLNVREAATVKPAA